MGVSRVLGSFGEFGGVCGSIWEFWTVFGNHWEYGGVLRVFGSFGSFGEFWGVFNIRHESFYRDLPFDSISHVAGTSFHRRRFEVSKFTRWVIEIHETEANLGKNL